MAFSKFPNFMAKINSTNGNEIKSDIFPWDLFECDIAFHCFSNIKTFEWLLESGIFQFHCKSEYKQVKWNKIERDIFKSDSNLTTLGIYFDKVYLKNE